ncbi:MAG TPA: GNAT family protein [Gemmatimonadaceae bacterium]
MIDGIRVVPTGEKYVEGFHRCVDAVARERRYLAFVHAPPLEGTRAFVRALVAGAGIQVLAVDEADTVVGWCDIVRHDLEGFRHVGKLGMGLLPSARGAGVGTRLATTAIERAWDAGLERIELEVFASNKTAIKLYHRIGFAEEGVKRRARKIDDAYDDNIVMALLRPLAP